MSCIVTCLTLAGEHELQSSIVLSLCFHLTDLMFVPRSHKTTNFTSVLTIAEPSISYDGNGCQFPEWAYTPRLAFLVFLNLSNKTYLTNIFSEIMIITADGYTHGKMCNF